MAPIAPQLQRRQRALPLSPEPQAKTGPVPATRVECEELYLFLKTRKALGWTHGMGRAEVRVGLSTMVNRHVADRKLQQIMAAAPVYGFPLASNSASGYFIIGSLDDVDTCIDELNSRISEHAKRVRALERIRERFRHGQEAEASTQAQGHEEDAGT